MRGSRYLVGQVSTFAYCNQTSVVFFCDEISRLGDEKNKLRLPYREFLGKKSPNSPHFKGKKVGIAILDSDNCIGDDCVRHLAAKNTCLEASSDHYVFVTLSQYW